MLGCTHYPFLTKLLADKLPQVRFVDSGAACVDYCQGKIPAGMGETTLEVYTSGEEQQFWSTLERLDGEIFSTLRGICKK